MSFVNINSNLKISSKNYNKNNKTARRVLVIFIILIFILVVPSILIFVGLKETLNHGKGIISSYKNQNFDSLETEIKATQAGLQKTNIGLNLFFWMKIIPILSGYYSDIKGISLAGTEELSALELIVSNLSTSKSELGFDNHPKSGPDRITQGIKILNKSLPFLDKIQPNLESAANDVSSIDINKYPDKFYNKQLRKNLDLFKNFTLGAEVAVKSGKNALTIAPQALGLTGPKTYLTLFQNDKEIRATGGFMTSYATLELNNGQVKSTTSDDIYRLDEKLLNVCLTKICALTPPAPIIKYLPEVSGKPRLTWSMRDSNLSPDVPTSAKEFERMYQMLGEGLPFDGIIYIDSNVVQELIKITGPIDVYGTKYSAEIDKRCNCPNVIYELESYAEVAAAGEKDRKAVLGVLMQQILARSVGSDIEKLPQLIEVMATLANNKHIIFYMHDPNTQKALSDLNWTGEIKNYDGDYLHINDSNFAGGKSNLYVTQSITQEINIQNNSVKRKISIEYSNPEPFNNWLNGINRDYVRFYVPLGSKLISSRGSENPVTTIEDLGKTVFEAFVQVRPQNDRKLEIEYEIPYKPSGSYKLLIQKQPGAKNFEYIIKLNNSQKADFNLETDKEFKFNI